MMRPQKISDRGHSPSKVLKLNGEKSHSIERGMGDWLEWLIKGIRDSVIPIILSLIATTFLQKTFLQRIQDKREHSMTLNDKGFKVWLNKINDLCPIDMEYNLPRYSHEESRIVPIGLKKLDLFAHSKFLESHMKTGYPKEWKFWEGLRESIRSFNRGIANSLEDIRLIINQISSFLELCEYYDRPEDKFPMEYIRPDELAKEIFNEIISRVYVRGEWTSGGIHKSWTSREGTKFFNLAIGTSSNFMIDTNEKKIDELSTYIGRIIEDENIKSKIDELRNMEKIIMNDRDEFRDILGNIRSTIEHTKNVKGRCVICSLLSQLRARN